MFNFLKKKSDLEKLIEKDGLEMTVAGFSRVISKKLSDFEIAYQFVLEELEAASMGNAEAQAFARSSGIPPSEYRGSLDNSRPEVDGPGGPQQTVIALCMQLQANTNLMVKFRIGILDKIMREYEFGKYAAEDGDDDVAFEARSDSRLAHIAAHVLNLSRSNLQLVGMGIKPEQVEGLVQSCADSIRDDVFEGYDTKVVAMVVMLSVAKNGIDFNEAKTACMLAMSVIWGANKMEEEGYGLTKEERATVAQLEIAARTLLMKHRSAVDGLQAKLLIATTLASESAQLTASHF